MYDELSLEQHTFSIKLTNPKVDFKAQQCEKCHFVFHNRVHL